METVSAGYGATQEIVGPDEELLWEPFPKQQEFLDAAFSGDYSFITYGGAVRGGKTFALLGLFILLCRFFPGSRWAVIRKNLPALEQNVYPVWRKIRPTNFLLNPESDPHGRTHISTFKNGSQIIFFPESHSTDKDKDRWKGFEVNGFGFEEINECQSATLAKAFERAGSYVVPKLEVQPKPLVIATCNPTQGWFKELVYTPHKEKRLKPSWLYIQSRIYDNIPLMRQQPAYLPQLKENLSRYEYEVFVEGNWDVQLKTGGEFLRGFELGIHVKQIGYNETKMLHFSIDSNVYPYISITVWQLIQRVNGWTIRQVDELPMEDPKNIASLAGKRIVEYLREKEYVGPVALHGDKSMKNRNNINEDKLSFYQIIEETLLNAGFQVFDKILKGPPPVHAIADFVNAIFDGKVPGLEIEIGENCKTSINDYIETKTNKDGVILKVLVDHPTIANVRYEKNGHMVDTLKDFIVQSFHDEYIQYAARHKKLLPGGINTVNRTTNITF